MRRLFILIAVVLIFSSCTKQFLNDQAFIAKEEIAKTIPARPQHANTEREAWVKYLQENLALDSIQTAAIPAGKYRVYIQFSIGQNRKIDTVKIFKDPGYGLAQLAAEVVKNYKADWDIDTEFYPSIRSYRMQPLVFLVEEE